MIRISKWIPSVSDDPVVRIGVVNFVWTYGWPQSWPEAEVRFFLTAKGMGDDILKKYSDRDYEIRVEK